MLDADDLKAVGLGLDHGWVELVEVRPDWVEIGDRFSRELHANLVGLVADVEHVGSTSVAGLLAKPIIDIAVGTPADANLTAIGKWLTERHWIFRGDAGDRGGHVYVLESQARRRVAHAHIVEHDSQQWCRYLALRTTLRASEEARRRYGNEKQRLVNELGRDNTSGMYTAGKSGVVAELLRT